MLFLDHIPTLSRDPNPHRAGSWLNNPVHLKMPLISTSLTAALTIGILTSGAPSPTNTNMPPDFVLKIPNLGRVGGSHFNLNT